MTDRRRADLEAKVGFDEGIKLGQLVSGIGLRVYFETKKQLGEARSENIMKD